jgi:hypothetical protein
MIRFVLLLFLMAIPVAAQTPAAIEKELLGYLKTMAESGSYSGEYDDAKLGPATDALKQKLMRYATRADVLKYDFPKLKEEMFVATSKDGKFRVYSWDLQTGGTMHDYDWLIQYVGDSGKPTAWADNKGEYDGGGALYTDVFQVNSARGPLYLLVSTTVASGTLNGQSIRAARIAGERLVLNPKVFRTGRGLADSIGFTYDFSTVMDRPERPVRLFTFNENRNEFKFPVVVEDDETPQGRVTSKFITYRFIGTQFVKVN